MLSDILHELELVKMGLTLNESRVSTLTLKAASVPAAPTASVSASSDRPTKEVANISSIEKLATLSSKTFVRWQTSLERHSRLIKALSLWTRSSSLSRAKPGAS